GFNSLAPLQWIVAHPGLNEVAWNFYNSLITMVLVVPIVLAVLKDRAALNLYFLAMIVASITGFIIYYFFPSIGSVRKNMFHIHSIMHKLNKCY
ncbi:unnamed protein product, partial [marine sediment metagenome]